MDCSVHSARGYHVSLMGLVMLNSGLIKFLDILDEYRTK